MNHITQRLVLVLRTFESQFLILDALMPSSSSSNMNLVLSYDLSV